MVRTLSTLVSLMFLVAACGDDTGPTGGVGGSASTTGGAGGTGGGDGGAGGSPAAACTIFGEECGDGSKCSIVDETLGIPDGLGCVEAGDNIAFASCDADTACEEGTYCDYSTSVCKPFCNVEAAECDKPDTCVVGRNSAGTPIPGLNLCVASCNPIAASDNPCADDPTTTCFYRPEVNLFDCGLSGQNDWAIDPCDNDRDCRYGLGCFDGECYDWCGPVGSQCFGTKPDGEWFCDQFEPCGTCQPTELTHEGTELGACTAWGM